MTDEEREKFFQEVFYEDDGFRFSFEDMERFGHKAYWVSLKIRTLKQRAVFSYIFDHPGCVLADIRENLGYDKDTLMPILRGLRERGVLDTDDLGPNRRYRYYINMETVTIVLEEYKQRIFKLFPDVEYRYTLKQLYQAEAAKLRDDDQGSGVSV